MWLDHIGLFGFYNWFKDDWLVSRRAVKLFLLSTLFIIATIPIFMGHFDPTKLPSWTRVAAGIEGVLGTLSLFFLWIGMWRYWIRLDNSPRPAKVASFILLLIGMFYGSALYYFFVYRPQVMGGRWNKPASPSREGMMRIPRWELQRVFVLGIFLLSGLALVFGLVAPVLLKKALLPQSDVSYEGLLEVGLSAAVFSFFVFLVVMLFRLGAKTQQGETVRSRWSFQKIIGVGLGSILGFALVFGFLVPVLLKSVLPPEYEDNYEVFFGLGLSAGGVVVLVYLIVMVFRTIARLRHGSQENARPRRGLQQIWFVGVLSIFVFMLVFGLLLNILVGKFLPQYVHGYSVFMGLSMVAGIISFFVYLIVGVFRLGMKTGR